MFWIEPDPLFLKEASLWIREMVKEAIMHAFSFYSFVPLPGVSLFHRGDY
jgi:hypothetical protein